jgi:aspartate dehydrogenase
LKIAVIGFGAIGSFVVEHLVAEPTLEIVGVLSEPPPPSKPRVRLFDGIDALLRTHPDVVVECAGHQALRKLGERVLRNGSDLLIASVGALADGELEAGLRRAASASGSRLLIPGGALGGIDAISAAREAGLTSVYYVGRKAPSAWKGTAAERLVDLNAVKQAKVFLEMRCAPCRSAISAKCECGGRLGACRTRFRSYPGAADRRSGGKRQCALLRSPRHFRRDLGDDPVVEPALEPQDIRVGPYSLIHSIKKRAGLVIT